MKDAIETMLKNNGLKITPGRKSVLEILMEEKEPLSIDEIKSKVSSNITTVYRILEKFVEKGLVYQTDFRDGKSYFEFQKNHHHHVTCTSCGKKEEVDVCIDNNIKTKNFKRIKSHMLEFFGECKECHE